MKPLLRFLMTKKSIVWASILLSFGTLSFAKPTEEELRAALKEDPNDEWALYNLGLARYLEQDYEKAVKLLGRLVEHDPTDWEAREKLIQALSGLDEEEKIAKHAKVLRANFESGAFEKLSERGFFIRDQFT
ncbi:MAG: tetratricopeptide repeat protein, partial [Verrucomicrobiota bacterium]